MTMSRSAPGKAAAARAGATVSIQGIGKRYGTAAPALDGVSLDIAAGEFVTLLGASGSGKTTTLMIVAGFTPPDAGEVTIDGQSVIGLPPERRGIGVVFQNYALFPHMTALRNVAFPLRMRAVPRGEAVRRAEAALERVGLAGLGARLPSQLSGGQQQRVALARALVFEPGLLLMDEPLGALDRALREQMKAEIRRLHRDLGITILYVTHDQEEALTLSDRIGLMHRGRIVQIGTPIELYEHPATRFVAQFIGESSLIEGTVGVAGSAGSFLVPLGGGPPLPARMTALPEGTPAALLLRPEKVVLHPMEGQAEVATAELVDVVYVGDITRSVLRLDGGATLVAKHMNRAGLPTLAPGMRVRVTWSPDDAILLADPSP
jgi:putative spermidine/putrescine transport system ATP-binding protein